MKKMIMPAVFALLYLVFIVIYVFIQRYKEFKEEEKDDLSQY